MLMMEEYVRIALLHLTDNAKQMPSAGHLHGCYATATCKTPAPELTFYLTKGRGLYFFEAAIHLKCNVMSISLDNQADHLVENDPSMLLLCS